MKAKEREALNRGMAGVLLITMAYPIALELILLLVNAALGLRIPGASLQNGLGISPAVQEGLRLLCTALPLALAIILGNRLPGQKTLPHKADISMRRLLPTALPLFLAATFIASILFGSLFPDSAPAALPERGAALWIALLSAAVIPGGGEELLFRGVVQSRLRVFGSGVAVLGQALLFAVLHRGPAQMLVALVSGLLLGLAMELTGKIALGMLLHTANNAIYFAELYLSLYMDEGALAVCLLLVNGAAVLAAAASLVCLGRSAWAKKLNRVEIRSNAALLLRCPLYWAAVGLLFLVKLVMA